MILECIATLIINNTNTWNKDDQEHLERAKVRCGEIYFDAPCLKKFEKVERLTYRAICGAESK